MYRAAEEEEEGQQERDKTTIKELFKVCKVDLEDESINRIVIIREKSDDKTRPILVELKDKEDKIKMFRNIAELRNAEDKYSGLSIGNE